MNYASRLHSCLGVLGLTGSLLAPAAAEAQLNFETAMTYESSLDEAPGMYSELKITTCSTARNSNAGTKDAVMLQIHSIDNSVERYYLNGPQEDFKPGATDVYQFRLPKGQLSRLKWWTLQLEGSDTWCIEKISLTVNGGEVMKYDADHPLAHDSLHSSVPQSGKGPIILSKDADEAPSWVVGFSDVQLGATYIGLPLRRSVAWTNATEDLEAHDKNTTCSLPTTLSWGVLYTIVATELGDKMSNDEDLYWGDDGLVNVGATNRGSKPVYHVKARFQRGKAKVTVNFDIKISCGADADGNIGMHFVPTTPDVDVDLSLGQKVLRGIADIFTVGLAEVLIKIPTTGKSLEASFTKTPICPALSVDSNDNMKMDWPEVVDIDKMDLTQKQRAAIPDWVFDWAGGKVTIPPNPLCIDMSTVKF